MRNLRPWVLILLLAGVIATGVWYFTRPDPVEVVLVKADRGPVERTVANTRAATVTACRRAKLAPPSGGQIARLLVREGDRVKKNQVLLELWSEEFTTPSPPGIPTPPAIDLIDDSCLYVTAPIDEVDAPAIKLEMPARISVDAFPGRKFPAHVRRIAPYVLDVAKQARTVDVEVEFNEPKETGALLVGYSADVEVILDARGDVLRVPTAAIQEGGRVLLYHPDNQRLEERRVQTGLSNWEYTEVTSGLNAGDQMVLSLERKGVAAGAKVVPEKRQ